MLGLVLEDKPVWIELGEYKRIVLASCRMSDGGGWTVIQVTEAIWCAHETYICTS